MLTERVNDPAERIGLQCELIVKGQPQWERARESANYVQMSVSVCVRARGAARGHVCVGLIVVQPWGTAERAHIWHRGTSMVTGNLTTQPVLWWQVSVCVFACVCVCGWERVTGAGESVRKKSALKKGRWAVKCLPAHPACSHDSFKNSKDSCKQFLRKGADWEDRVATCVCVSVSKRACLWLNRREALLSWITDRKGSFAFFPPREAWRGRTVVRVCRRKLQNKCLHGFVCDSVCAAAVCVCMTA